MPYSPREYAEMYYCYGAAQGNARAAARMYREQVLRRGGPQPEVYPDYRVILRVRNAYMEGRIPGTTRQEGVPRNDPDRVEQVLGEVREKLAIVQACLTCLCIEYCERRHVPLPCKKSARFGACRLSTTNSFLSRNDQQM